LPASQQRLRARKGGAVQKIVAGGARREFRESNVQHIAKRRDLQEVTLEHTYIKLVLSAKKHYRFNFGSI